jgi:hypothetical protein
VRAGSGPDEGVVLKVGMRIVHPERGAGVVSALVEDDAEPYAIVFDGGDVQRYSKMAARKLRLFACGTPSSTRKLKKDSVIALEHVQLVTALRETGLASTPKPSGAPPTRNRALKLRRALELMTLHEIVPTLGVDLAASPTGEKGLQVLRTESEIDGISPNDFVSAVGGVQLLSREHYLQQIARCVVGERVPVDVIDGLNGEARRCDVLVKAVGGHEEIIQHIRSMSEAEAAELTTEEQADSSEGEEDVAKQLGDLHGRICTLEAEKAELASALSLAAKEAADGGQPPPKFVNELKSEHEEQVQLLQRQLESAHELSKAYLKQIEEIQASSSSKAPFLLDGFDRTLLTHVCSFSLAIARF